MDDTRQTNAKGNTYSVYFSFAYKLNTKWSQLIFQNVVGLFDAIVESKKLDGRRRRQIAVLIDSVRSTELARNCEAIKESFAVSMLRALPHRSVGTNWNEKYAMDERWGQDFNAVCGKVSNWQFDSVDKDHVQNARSMQITNLQSVISWNWNPPIPNSQNKSPFDLQLHVQLESGNKSWSFHSGRGLHSDGGCQRVRPELQYFPSESFARPQRSADT